MVSGAGHRRVRRTGAVDQSAATDKVKLGHFISLGFGQARNGFHRANEASVCISRLGARGQFHHTAECARNDFFQKSPLSVATILTIPDE